MLGPFTATPAISDVMPTFSDLLLTALTCTRRGGEGLLTEGRWSRLLPLHLGTADEAGLLPADIQEGGVGDVH